MHFEYVTTLAVLNSYVRTPISPKIDPFSNIAIILCLNNFDF